MIWEHAGAEIKLEKKKKKKSFGGYKSNVSYMFMINHSACLA